MRLDHRPSKGLSFASIGSALKSGHGWLARRRISELAAIVLALFAALVFATQGLAVPERGLTVALPDAEPMPERALAAIEGRRPDGMLELDPDRLLTPSEALRLSPVEAQAVLEAIRADLPAASGYTGPRPAGIRFGAASSLDRDRALQCLTQAVYYEAANEPEAGKRAVAQVVLNRVRHPDYPNSICSVVYQGSERSTGCQFTFTCDGALARSPAARQWGQSRRVAEAAINGRAFGEVGYATHYHTYEVWPYWGRTLTMTNMIGRHIFHRLRGRGGSPGYFTQRYSGRESGPRPWRPRARQRASEQADRNSAIADAIADAARSAEEERARQAVAQQPNNLPPAPVARVEQSRPVERPARVEQPNNLPQSNYREGVLPNSQVRPEFQDSGRWIGG